MLLPSPLPGSLGISSSQGTLFTPSTYRYDYAIGGLPFLSAASREYPIVRETAQIRKQQFDNASTPGEQSLEGWWLRSQQSFHGGAGQLFVEPSQDNPNSLIRFKASRNVNVWNQGRVFLLNAAKKAAGSPIANVVDGTEVVYPNGANTAVLVGGTSVYVVQASTVNTYVAPSANPTQSVTTDGTNVYVSAIDGIWSAPVPATPGTNFTWTKQYTVSVTTGTHLTWVKARLMAGLGPSIYELPPRPGTPPAALPAAKYTHSDPAFVWTGFTDSPAAIYAVGNNGVRGSILKFVLDNSTGAIPTLSAGAVAAQLPSGEVPYSIMGYLGTYVGIGTNRGVRIATADGSGNLQYGPLLFTTTVAPKCWSARDRFLFVAVTASTDGDSGVYRIDLSTQVDTLRFAYATDLNFSGDATTAQTVVHLGSSDVLTFATVTDLYIEDTTKLATSGYLLTSRVRYSTLEPKLFKQVKTRGPAVQGSLSFTILDEGDHTSGSYTYPTSLSPGDVGDVDISQPQDPQDFVSVKYTFGRDVVNQNQGAEIWGYQLKALPGTKRQRMIQLPLLCYDWEHGPDGARRGYRGAALARLSALEDLEQGGNSIIFQDLGSGENAACVIEQVSFRQNQPPLGADGFGGVVLVTLRTL